MDWNASLMDQPSMTQHISFSMGIPGWIKIGQRCKKYVRCLYIRLVDELRLPSFLAGRMHCFLLAQVIGLKFAELDSN
jgi:hypothetical protein